MVFGFSFSGWQAGGGVVVFYLFSSVTYLYVLLVSCACTNDDGQLPSCAVGSGLCSKSVENRKKRDRTHRGRSLSAALEESSWWFVVGTRSRSQTGKPDSSVCFSLLFCWPFFGFLQVV